MMDFSLFFFSSYEVQADNKYRLLLDAVKYADQNGFNAVWTPERHFHEFGGLFPNPSVISSALAMITDQIELRSGSVVSPLHDPIRIAEEWSVVDNLSMGRVALSFASGWNSNDFALAKDNYDERHKIMYDQIELVKELWRGGSLKRENGIGKEIELKVFPSPVQEELPIWITAAGNEKTYELAGEMGANLLTHLLGQDIEEVKGKINVYREAFNRSGHGDKEGKVALMLHTYVGNDGEEIEETVEEPFTNYLRSATSLSKVIYEEAGFDPNDIPEEDREQMLKYSYMRYSQEAALIGTVDKCMDMADKIVDLGVDEIACLVDFGIEPNKVLDRLKNISRLKQLMASSKQSV